MQRLIASVCLCLTVAVPTYAQAPAPGSRVQIDLDVAQFFSHQDAQTFTFSKSLFSETASSAASYAKLPSVTDFVPTVTLAVHKGFGFSFRVDGQDYTMNPGLGVSIPSPFFFRDAATAVAPTATSLSRKDRAYNFQAVYTLPLKHDLLLRLYGGPTIFTLNADLVGAIFYLQNASPVLPINIVTINSFTSQNVTGSTVGFNVGADLSAFFSKHVGVGGGVQDNSGTITVTEPLSGTQQDFKMGHTSVNGGLRLRF
jgi:hypothetical protein